MSWSRLKKCSRSWLLIWLNFRNRKYTYPNRVVCCSAYVILYLYLCWISRWSELSRANRVSHDRHYIMVFPVEHPLFKFKSRTHTGLCLLFILMHDSLPPSPCSSYWSIQALQASLQFALNPIPTDQLSGQQQQQQLRLANLTHIRILLNSLLVVGAMAKKAWIKNKCCWACNKSKKKNNKVKNTR